MSGWLRTLRLSVRALVRSPRFSVPALVILTIGMTAATAIVTVVDSIAFQPLRLPDSERVIIICEDHPRIGDNCIASPGNVEDFRRASATLSELGVGRGWPFSLTDEEGTTGVRGGIATAGFLRSFGLAPALGRLFTDDEAGPGRDDVVLLSHGYWVRRFGADPTVVGRNVDVDGAPHEVVGVLSADFEGPFAGLRGIELWKPLHFDPLDPERRGWRGFRAIGRLADGATVASASAELGGLYRGLGERHEEIDDEWRLRVQPLLTEVLGDTRPVLLAFLGAAGLLLLIVCANVANLILGRGLARGRELAVRVALGAGRARLVGEILVESFVLAGAATVLALALANGATELIVALAPPEIPRLDEVAVDARVLALTGVLTLATTALFAIVPALWTTSTEPGHAVRSGRRGGRSRALSRLQSSLVVAELALSVVMLSGAALLTRSFVRYLDWDPGFDRGALTAVSLFLNQGEYDSAEKTIGFYRRAEQRVASVPGVVSVASASAGPLFGGGDGATPFAWDGSDLTGPLPSARWFDIGPRYFETLGLALRQGREFTELDVRGSPPVAIVNEALARVAWPEGDAIGRRLRLPDLDGDFEVVGVVQDVVPLTPGEQPPPEVYWSNRQSPRGATFFLVRVDGDPAALGGAVESALMEIDPDLAMGSPRTLDSEADARLVRPRFQAVVLAFFAVVALALSAVGVYAVISYSVTRRIQELGIRMALGAVGTDVLAMVFRSTLSLSLIGVLAGLAGAVATGRLIEGLVPGVSARDVPSLAVATVTILFVTGLATVLPAARAARADPLTALHTE